MTLQDLQHHEDLNIKLSSGGHLYYNRIEDILFIYYHATIREYHIRTSAFQDSTPPMPYMYEKCIEHNIKD